MLVLDTLNAQLSIPISKNWTYQSVNDESWLNCQIPNSIYNILEQSNIIQSPFLGNAEAKLDWISKKTWYSRIPSIWIFKIFNMNTSKFNSKISIPMQKYT